MIGQDSDTITVSPIETVTVESTHLMDWPRFALAVAIFLAVLKALK